MRYWMRFIDNQGEDIFSLSTNTFMGDEWNLSAIKDRFNQNFVRNTSVRAVCLSFMHNNRRVEFLAGIRYGDVVIVNTKTKKEYTPKEFSESLNTIDQVITGNALQP